MQLYLAGGLVEGRRRHLRIVLPDLIEQPLPQSVLVGDYFITQLQIRMTLMNRGVNWTVGALA
jgi:hypothetical protein